MSEPTKHVSEAWDKQAAGRRKWVIEGSDCVLCGNAVGANPVLVREVRRSKDFATLEYRCRGNCTKRVTVEPIEEAK